MCCIHGQVFGGVHPLHWNQVLAAMALGIQELSDLGVILQRVDWVGVGEFVDERATMFTLGFSTLIAYQTYNHI